MNLYRVHALSTNEIHMIEAGSSRDAARAVLTEAGPGQIGEKSPGRFVGSWGEIATVALVSTVEARSLGASDFEAVPAPRHFTVPKGSRVLGGRQSRVDMTLHRRTAQRFAVTVRIFEPWGSTEFSKSVGYDAFRGWLRGMYEVAGFDADLDPVTICECAIGGYDVQSPLPDGTCATCGWSILGFDPATVVDYRPAHEFGEYCECPECSEPEYGPGCAICGVMASEHSMEGYPGHPFTYRDREAEAIEDAAIESERLAEVEAEDRKHRGMERFEAPAPNSDFSAEESAAIEAAIADQETEPRCRYCGAATPDLVCDNCDAQQEAQAMESTGLFAEAIGDLMMTSVKPGTGPLTERLSARLASIDCEIDRLSEERSRLLAALPEHHAQAIEDEAGFLNAPDAISAEEAEARGADDQGGDSWVAATIAHLRSVGLIPEGAR